MKTREEHDKANKKESTIKGRINDDDEVISISTQEMIQDARERRKNKTTVFNCDQCIYTSGSKTLLQNTLLDKVIIALFLEPSTPSWLKNIGANPVKLGLDLSGGVHFLLEVDIDTAQQGRLELLLDTYRNTFKDERIRFDKSSIEDLALYFQFSKLNVSLPLAASTC